MPSKTKNPLAEAMRELKADPTSGVAPGRENDTCRKSEAQTGRGYADNSRTLRRRSSPATPCTGRPGEEHGPRTAAGSLERPVPENAISHRLLDAGCTLKPVACRGKAHGKIKLCSVNETAWFRSVKPSAVWAGR